MLEYSCNWSGPEFANSLPASTRLQQIDFLLNLFELKQQTPQTVTKRLSGLFGFQSGKKGNSQILADLGFVTSGRFLMQRESQMQILAEKIKTEVKTHFPSVETEVHRQKADLYWMFNDLYVFRKQAYQFCNPPSGMQEGFSTGLYYSFYLQSKLKDIVAKNLDEIDQTLCLAMDLQQRRFDKNTVGFPDADLAAIDLEWQMENY